MSPSDDVKVACLQVGLRAGETRRTRVERVLELVARGPAADVVVLPELWDVGYFAFDDYAAAACTLDSGTARAIAEIAGQRRAIVVGGSVVERDGPKLFNTIVVAGPDGRLAGSYRKTHLFPYRSREAEILAPGSGPVVVEVASLRVGLAICFDLRFPEHFTRLRDAGAELIFVPAAWPTPRVGDWEVLARARAIDNQTPLAAVNGAGVSAGVELPGRSALFDARGAIVARADGTADAWVVGTVRRSETRQWRQEFPLGAEALSA